MLGSTVVTFFAAVYRALQTLVRCWMLLMSARECGFLGVYCRSGFRIQRLLARQWIQVWRQSTRLWYFTHFPRGCELGPSLCPFTPAFADEEVAALVVDNGGMAGDAGYDAPRAVPFTVACARRFSQLQFLDDVVVPVVVQRQVACPAVDADSRRCLRLVHRQGVRGLRRGSFWDPSHQVQERASCPQGHDPHN